MLAHNGLTGACGRPARKAAEVVTDLLTELACTEVLVKLVAQA